MMRVFWPGIMNILFLKMYKTLLTYGTLFFLEKRSIISVRGGKTLLRRLFSFL